MPPNSYIDHSDVLPGLLHCDDIVELVLLVAYKRSSAWRMLDGVSLPRIKICWISLFVLFGFCLCPDPGLTGGVTFVCEGALGHVMVHLQCQ